MKYGVPWVYLTKNRDNDGDISCFEEFFWGVSESTCQIRSWRLLPDTNTWRVRMDSLLSCSLGLLQSGPTWIFSPSGITEWILCFWANWSLDTCLQVQGTDAHLSSLIASEKLNGRVWELHELYWKPFLCCICYHTGSLKCLIREEFAPSWDAAAYILRNAAACLSFRLFRAGPSLAPSTPS